MEGEWVVWTQHGEPKGRPKLPKWGPPKGWRAGLRPKPRRNRRAASAQTNGNARNGNVGANRDKGHGRSLVSEIEAMEKRIGRHMYLGLLKRVKAFRPQQIPDSNLQQQVLAQMESAERGLARLEAAQARLAPGSVQKIFLALKAPIKAKIEDLQTLESLVLALEKEVEAAETRTYRSFLPFYLPVTPVEQSQSALTHPATGRLMPLPIHLKLH